MMLKLLEVKNLKKYYPVRRGILRSLVDEIKAVDDISFTLSAKEILALVGESGSGKSTVGRTIIRLTKPTEGQVLFNGRDLFALSERKLRSLRPELQIIFQDPLVSLNPRKTIFENIGEALLYHRHVQTKEQQKERVLTILKKIGLPAAALTQYPHQFSGGQQQRISIGRAIALNPKLIICDEVVSALDLSVQAQILNLLYELKENLNLSYLFISHDLSLVRNFCDTVLVMYRGKIVERGTVKEIFEKPRHPYTQLLFDSMPKEHPKERSRPPLPIPLDRKPGSGCPFYNRCPRAKPACTQLPAPLQRVSESHCYSCIH